MTTTEKVLNIYQRLNAIMSEVTAVQKEDKKVNNQYTFVSHDAVAAALHGPMVKHGVVMVPSVAEIKQDGNRTEVKMEISFVNVDDSADRIVVMFPGYGIDPSDKGIGKAISYAVKYALLKVFCLETGDDVEKHNMEYKAPEKQAASQVIEISMDDFLLVYPDAEKKDVRECLKDLCSKTGKSESFMIARAQSNIPGFNKLLEEWKSRKV